MTGDPARARPPGTPSFRGLFQRGMVGALIRYRVMAFVVGTALICLFIVVIFQVFGAKVKLAEEIVAPVHGYLYLVYLVAAADLARRAHWRLGRILMVVAGRLRAHAGLHRRAPRLPADAGRVGGRSRREPERSSPPSAPVPRHRPKGAAPGRACAEVPDRQERTVGGLRQRAPRRSVPGRAPVSSPSAKVVTPDLMVST